jgi:tmRNA-binding protein
MFFLFYIVPEECDHDWEYYSKSQLVTVCQEYHREITSQVELVDSYKLHLAFPGDEVKALRAEAGELRDKLTAAHAELVRLKSEMQTVKSANLEFSKVEVPALVAERNRLNTALGRSGRSRLFFSRELKSVQEKYRDLSVKYASLKEVIMSQGIEKVRKFLELCSD